MYCSALFSHYAEEKDLLDMARKLKRKKKPVGPIVWLARKLRGWLRVILKFSLGLIFICILVVAVFRIINPPITYYIASEWIRIGEMKRDWTPIEDFQPYVARAIVAAEDANFCQHSGFDYAAIKLALNGKGRLRGASTISQQTAKNVFLWQGRTWVRKGLEVGFTVLIELLWPKQRIVEIYLNVAEFDEGVFGVAAAGRHYFGVEPDKITRLQAARLAAVLPNPKNRSASRPKKGILQRADQILSGAETIAADGRAECFSRG